MTEFRGKSYLRRKQIAPSSVNERLEQLGQILFQYADGICLVVRASTHAELLVLKEPLLSKSFSVLGVKEPKIGWLRYLPIPRPKSVLLQVIDPLQLHLLFNSLLEFLVFELLVFDTHNAAVFKSERLRTEIWPPGHDVRASAQPYYRYFIDTDHDDEDISHFGEEGHFVLVTELWDNAPENLRKRLDQFS